MNGPPAKPISGQSSSSATRERTASVTYGTSPGSSARSRARSADVRTGRSGTTMSLNKMAASTSYLRSGCRVISVISSGRVHESSMEMPSRTRRYSGSDRPAWRMNQMGV